MSGVYRGPDQIVIIDIREKEEHFTGSSSSQKVDIVKIWIEYS